MANGIVLNIDTTKSEFQNPMIELRQGDGNYQSLDVTVTSNGSPLNLTGWTITFMGTTAGGFKVVDTAVSNVEATNGKFTYTPTKAWGQDEGMFKEAYFKFTSGANGNSVASGASLRVNVLTAVDLTAAEAGNYISVVDQTISKLNGDLSTLQRSVDNLKTQNNAIKTTDNTWTGKNKFAQPVDSSLKTNPYPLTTLQELYTKMTTYAGNWSGGSSTITDMPETGYGIISVLPYAESQFAGVIIVTYTESNKIFMAYAKTPLVWLKVANDSTVVHSAGTETITGDKTFTGYSTFTQSIDANIKVKDYPSTKLQDLATQMRTYAGEWVGGSNKITDMPEPGYATISVKPYGQSQTAGTITINYTESNKMFTSYAKTPLVWLKVANDNTVVHNTGTETINGDKTLRSGNYGLRVTTSGIQKTTDNGVTWVNI